MRPFYYSLLIFTVLVAFSWVVRHWEHAATRVHLSTTSEKLVQRRGVHDELEVSPHPSPIPNLQCGKTHVLAQ